MLAWLVVTLLLAGCVLPATSTVTEGDPPAYTPQPLRPDNCGTPFKPSRCEPEGRPFEVIWTPEPFYPIIQEPLPDMTPPPDVEWERPPHDSN